MAAEKLFAIVAGFFEEKGVFEIGGIAAKVNVLLLNTCCNSAPGGRTMADSTSTAAAAANRRSSRSIVRELWW